MTTVDLRKRPKQARSLARFNHILDQAAAMIAEQGNTELVMNELARRAEVNIASIYQYFPNRVALLRQLIERYLEHYQQALHDSLLAYQGDHQGVVDLIVDGYEAFFSSQPVFATLWAEAQGDPDLKRLDIQDSQHNATVMAEALQSYFPHVVAPRLQRLCFMFCDLSGGMLQTALCLPKSEARQLLDEYKGMLRIFVANV